MSLVGLIEIAPHRVRQRRAERQPPRPRMRSQAGDQRRRQPDREHRRALRHRDALWSIQSSVHVPTRLALGQAVLGLQRPHRVRGRQLDQQPDRAIHSNRILVGIRSAAGHQPLEYHASRPTPSPRPRNRPLELEVRDCVGAVTTPPWGVPSSVRCSRPFSTTPAFSHCRIIPLAGNVPIMVRMWWWAMRSKEDTTHCPPRWLPAGGAGAAGASCVGGPLACAVGLDASWRSAGADRGAAGRQPPDGSGGMDGPEGSDRADGGRDGRIA